MFIEIHVLQNYALSNLNRDDTGAPKSCYFGGIRRARVSSQCLKRAIRTYFREESLVPSAQLSYRTKWLLREIIRRITAAGVDPEKAATIAENAINSLDFKIKKNKTEYLIMLGEKEIEKVANVCIEHQDELLEGVKSKKDTSSISAKLLSALDGGEAIDVALFGRMIATHADKGVDAAVQMAHAFSTHPVSTEFDFYSAVDDLQSQDGDEGAGAGMLGTLLYNSSCYYRYANLDIRQLLNNLNGDLNDTATAIRAFLQAAIFAVPSGKKTNSAPQNLPALIITTVRDKMLWSLANAYVNPVFPGPDSDLIQLSGKRLLEHWGQLSEMYGTEGIKYAAISTYLPGDKIGLGLAPTLIFEPKVSALLDKTVDEIKAYWN